MNIEKVLNGRRYTLSNDNLQVNDKVYPVANGRCFGKDEWILHGFDFKEHSSGFLNDPHTIIDLNHSNYKPYQVRTSHGYGPIETYYKVIKVEKHVEKDPNARFISYEWIEI
jgi:hypothetical protein